MIIELSVENFIIADRLECSFNRGFNVLTGETGAGKSIIVQAIKLLLGARAESALVRSGAERAMVQGIFHISDDRLKLLNDADIPVDESNELLVRRIIPAGGKRGRIFVNGTAVTLQELKRLMQGVVSISGQHEYHDLLNREVQKKWLDIFADTLEMVSETGRLVKRRKILAKELNTLLEKEKHLSEMRDEYKRDAERIDTLAPKEGEDERLEQRLSLLRSAKELGNLGGEIFNRLYNSRGAIYESLSECRSLAEKMCRHDSSLDAWFADMDSLVHQTEELAWRFRDYIQELPHELAEYERLEERLYGIKQLKRLFGPSLEDVIEYRAKLDADLSMLEDMAIAVAEAEKILEKHDILLRDAAMRLSDARNAAAEEFARHMRRELADLKLNKAGFKITVRQDASLNIQDNTEKKPVDCSGIRPDGADEVEFLFCPNPGEPFRPLSSIASGGELSRVMLAVRSVLAKKTGTGAVIFDEIDAGIGGEVANRVGDKLAALAKNGQVIAITHFPQIAALGEAHYRVSKQVSDNRTISEITELDSNERIKEIARMLGGERNAAMEYASRLAGKITECKS